MAASSILQLASCKVSGATACSTVSRTGGPRLALEEVRCALRPSLATSSYALRRVGQGEKSGYGGDLTTEEAHELLQKLKRALLVDVRPQKLRNVYGIPALKLGARFKQASVDPIENHRPRRTSSIGNEKVGRNGGAFQRALHLTSAVADAASAQSPSRGANEEDGGTNEGLYKPFIEYAVKALEARMELWPYPIKEEFIRLEATDSKGQKAVTDSTFLQSHKLRQVRAANIQAGNNLQVLNLIMFPRPEYDLPYFCADLVTLPRGHLQIIDLNPLHSSPEHFQKHIKPLLPITNKYVKVLPWGGEFTAESLQFFSPALLWTRPSDRTTVQTVILEAFKEYVDAYAEMVANAVPTSDPVEIARNRAAQHKYICWRAEKDPGRPVITRLYGTELCEAYIHGFLFDGIYELGTKTFLDYFPEYRGPDGTVIKKRSVVGKKCVTRPWDPEGNFVAPD